MKLEEKLARWAEQPEGTEDDDDYGLIIDDSVTAAPAPAPAPAPSPPLPTAAAAAPKFIKAGSCSQLPLSRATAASAPLGFLPANLHSLADSYRLAKSNMQSPADTMNRFVENDDNENYDDLVLPEEADLLDRQLSEWKTPCRRIPSWPGELGAQVTMSGATAVESVSGLAGGEWATPTLGSGEGGNASRRNALPATSKPGNAPKPKAVGLGLVEGGKAASGGSPRQHRAPSSKQSTHQRHQNHIQNPNYSYSRGGAADVPQQQMRPGQLPSSLLQQTRSGRRPMLIRNTQRPAEPIVVGCMKYDPVGRMWIGNEEEGARIASAIAESERQLRARGIIRNERPIDAGKLARKISQRSGNPNLVPALLLPDDMLVDGSSPPPLPDSPASPPAATSPRLPWRCAVPAMSPTSPLGSPRAMQGRPALISPSAAVLGAVSSGACARPRPIFDPQNLRWIDPNENQHDSPGNPFWNIAALPLEPPLLDAIRQKSRHRSATQPMGADADHNCFALSEEQIDAYHRESAEYEAFARHWFPNSPSA
ncbi:hypothetical protein GGI04_002503 [Coemansia thaxteri]|nr:hypothetical protein GGI04_002503 [Coemansia thaxteri]KAJ2471890.1 hypothetical protein GGI02_001958 [Coemansia sp. RSA 2322]